MKMKNMIAVLSAMAVSAVGMSAMTFSASAAEQIGQAYLVGSFGTEQNWNPGENAGVSIVPIDGDAQYECTWELSQATNTGTSGFFITVVIEPTSLDNFTTDTIENLEVSLDEVWVDGTELSGYDASSAVNTAYYESATGVTRIYLRSDWADGGLTKIIADNTDITESIKVVFTVSGTGAEGTSNVVTEEETQPEESSTPEEESSVVEESSSTADSSSAADSSSTTSSTTSTTTSTTSSTTTTTNTNTGDAGVAALVAAVAAAGAAVVVTAKKNK